jgi:small subunit ribosomal protein S8
MNMVVTDPIADMLTRIRNANMVYHEKVDIPSSRIKLELARILRDQGFIKNFKLVRNRKQGVIRIYMKYGPSRERIIGGMERISKSSLRVYVPAHRIPKVMNGLGIAILSTSKGVLTDQEARLQKVGGELLCKIW